MTISKNEATGTNVHKQIKYMVKNYGAMVMGIRAETLGQNAANMNLASVKKIGNIKDNINEVVKNSDMTEPTNSCGQASNDVCTLLLGADGASQFEKVNYNLLRDQGTNLKDSLPDANSLIRIEVDRYNGPNTYRKIKKEEFNPDKAERNKVYLLEDQLLYIAESGKIIDLEQTPAQCKALFDAIVTPFYSHYALDDGFMEPSGGPEEAAICRINEIFQQNNVDCWRSTHSFTIFAPQAEEGNARKIYPYQAYWTKHTLQAWYLGNKDESLSQLGLEGYLAKLNILGTTTDDKVRSDTYAALFAPPGRESIFCAGMNQKTSRLRVKFKITEVNPELALELLKSQQEFIDTHYPGDSIEQQCELYKTKAQNAMTQQLEARLAQAAVSTTATHAGRSELGFFNQTNKTTVEHSFSSVMTIENLKLMAKNADTLSPKEQEKALQVFKSLPQELLTDIKQDSDIAQKAWDEQYGLVPKK